MSSNAAAATRVDREVGLEDVPGAAVVVAGGEGGSACQAWRSGDGTAGLFAWRFRMRAGVLGRPLT